MTKKNIEQEWEEYISSGEYTVIMDNDGWWFKKTDDEEGEWEGGGSGPYGIDLLEFMLERSNVKMEWV